MHVQQEFSACIHFLHELDVETLTEDTRRISQIKIIFTSVKQMAQGFKHSAFQPNLSYQLSSPLWLSNGP